MKIKAILVSTLLTALFAGTSAIAGDNDHFAKADYGITNSSVEKQKVSYQLATIDIEGTVISGRK